jgi:hypothetical protein
MTMIVRSPLALVAAILLLAPAAAGAADPLPKPALPPGAALAIELPPQVRWSEGVRIPVIVTNRVADARDVGVASGPFVDPKSSDPLQVDFCLADKIKAKCLSSLSLAADSQHQMWLVGTGLAKAGSYSGTVRFQASSGQMASAATIINVTTDRWRLAGFVALLVGTLLSFYMSVWIPHQRTRESAILPFARLAERLEEIRRAVDPAVAPFTLREAGQLMAELQPTWLETHQLIPSRWPSPSAATTSADALRAHAEQAETRLIAIELLSGHIAQQTDPAVATQLDNLATDPAFPQPDLQSRIANVIGVRPAMAPAPATLTPADIIYREDVRNLVYWIISSVLAVLLGFVLMVDANPAFGGWADVAAALLWALGIATTGTKLADLTVANVRAALRA